MEKRSSTQKSNVAPPSAVARFYVRQLKNRKALVCLLLIGTVGIQAAGLTSPLFLRQFFNTLASHDVDPQTIHALLVTIGWIGLIGFLGWAARRLQSLTILHIEARAMASLYTSAFDHLIGHSYQFFVSQFGGTLTRRVSKYASAFETLFDSVVLTFTPTIIFVCGAVTILYLRNHTLGIVLGLWSVFFFLFQIFVSRLRQPLRQARAEEDSALTGTIADAIANQNTIMLFSGYGAEHMRMERAVGRWRAATLRSWLADDFIWGMQGLLMVGINVGLLYGALQFWERGLITVGDFVLIQAYLLGIFDQLISITRELRRVYDGLADAGEMVHILQKPHGVADRAGAAALVVEKGGIVFDHVDFHFNAERPILRDFSLRVAGGEKVALVGPSGAGKSTITRLLLRFYDVIGGAIEIDGQDIAAVRQESLRDAIAFVPQEPILFHRTLMENIRYGRRDATDEEVMEAARKAHCHEFISALPERYDTYVGERGVRLSGGERQRIAIARAILRDAPILILDEATSSLDSESEALIQDALEKLMEGKTVIAIAHRLSTIMHMDRILVLERGAIVDEGTHEELLERGGLYQKLWSIQAGGFAPEALADELETEGADADKEKEPQNDPREVEQ
jgi:ATP-binding cassette subfamily B protein